MTPRYNRSIQYLLLALGSLAATGETKADDLEGFTEPRYQILVAAPETGIVNKLNVKEGDQVTAGQVLGVLDDDILEASLAIAKKAMESQGTIQSAQAEFLLKEDRLKRFEELYKKNHASTEEVQRAQMEKEVAEARVLAANEAQEVKELEYQRAKVQLARRRIHSPINGVVLEVHKDIGEFVSPTDAVVFTVVQLDPLLATFSIPAPQAAKLSFGQHTAVYFEAGDRKALGTISFVSPVINAQSGTVKVKVEIPNVSGQFQSGQRCRLLPGGVPTQISQGNKSSR